MRRSKGIVWGIILVIIGIILGGNSLELFDIDIFFDGWWTLFIIIPSFIGLISDSDKTGSVIGLIIGVVLLLACQDIVDFEIIWKLIFPAIIIIFGLSLIFKNIVFNEADKEFKKLSKKIGKDSECVAVFSSQEINVNKEKFDGSNLCAIFGGIDLDLRNATIKEDAVINLVAVFGGIDIFVPEDVNVVIKSNSIFGGVDNHKKKQENKKKTIYINATCVFGGADIK